MKYITGVYQCFIYLLDNLLDRSVLMTILSHVASLKQMGILHMVQLLQLRTHIIIAQ